MEIYALIDQQANLARNQQVPARRCWILDENFSIAWQAALQLSPNDCVLSNRFDVTRQLQDRIEACHFCDFDFDVFGSNAPQVLLYRASKERPVTNRVLNMAASHLNANGQLVLAGNKDEGIKGYVQKACAHLGFTGKLKKFGNCYCAVLHKNQEVSAHLDDKNYSDFQTIAEDDLGQYISKPGVYGWNKIDQGSKLLRECFLEEVSPQLTQKQSAIDLGCGYGYLTVALEAAGFQKIYATDNNAAAISATIATLQANGVTQYKVYPGDAGDCFAEPADLVICNPPFHQGFEVQASLTEKFVKATARLTAPRGTALLVVNAFIPIEKYAKQEFASLQILANNRSFKVLRLQHYS